MQEDKLIDDLISGDEDAFRVLVKGYYDRVFHHAMQILRNREITEDVCQETFIQVFESIKKFERKSSLGTWIIRIAINKALQKLRKEKTNTKIREFLPFWMPNESRSRESTELHPDIQLEKKEIALSLYGAIDQLNPRQRIAFTLIKIDEVSYSEASKIMGLSIKAIESLVSRAKENIKKNLK